MTPDLRVTGEDPAAAPEELRKEQMAAAGLKERGPKDRALTRRVREVVASHPRLSLLPLEWTVKGGVAHLRGAPGSEDDRRLAREVFAGIRGLDAVWDVLGTEEHPRPRVLEIGCGPTKEVSWSTGVDREPCPGVDVIADLEQELPFGTGEIDYVFAVHVLEHIRNLTALMNEVHRVLKPGGIFHILVPHQSCVNAAADPTHVRFFNRQTFKYFCLPRPRVRPYRPVCVTSDHWNVFADLAPVPAGETLADDEELAYFFE